MIKQSMTVYEALGILGLKHGCLMTEVKSNYRKLAMKFHPDKNPGSEEAEKIMKKINMAYDVCCRYYSHAQSKKAHPTQKPKNHGKYTWVDWPFKKPPTSKPEPVRNSHGDYAVSDVMVFTINIKDINFEFRTD